MRKFLWAFYFLIFFISVILFFKSMLWAQDSTLVQAGEPIEVRLSTEVDKLEVPRNRLVTFTAKVEWAGDINRFEIVEKRDPDVENFDIFKNAEAHQTEIVDGKPISRAILEFTLKPQSLGMGYVGDMLIRYRDKSTGDERRLLTNRLGVKVIDPLPEPIDYQRIFYWIIISFAFIAVLAFGSISVLKKRALARKRQQELAAIVPLEQGYLDRLKNEVSLNSSEVKNEFSIISRIYREYLAEKYQIAAMEVTTQELISILGSENGDEKFLSDTNEILHTCDVVKFGGGQISISELTRIYTLVENILEKNLTILEETEANSK